MSDSESLATPVSSLTIGDSIVVEGENGTLIADEVKNILYEWENCDVYDLSIKNTRNFISGGVLVHNCIYSFKGSDSRILTECFDKDFRPTMCTLSYNYRCPSNILNPVVPSIHKNLDSANQVIIPFKEGGEFSAKAFGSYKSMVEHLVDSVYKDAEEGKSVAILCRTNFDGAIPAFVLEARRQWDFSISGDNMTMNSPLAKSLMNFTSLFTEKSTPAVRSCLETIGGI